MNRDAGRPFKDHFSGHATVYAATRPHYPAALFDWLAEQAPARTLAWDAGCGNGQASLALAERFDRVVAMDPSAQQIAAAAPHPRVEYRVEPAEAPSLDRGSVDLVTVAQALHWFEHEAFYTAVRRVLRPGGLIAAWTYALCRVTPAVDDVLATLYDDWLSDYWPAERRHVDAGYRTLPFPFAELAAPVLAIELDWPLERYLAYLRSWSAAERYRTATGTDAVTALADRFTAAWGDPSAARTVHWPIALRAGLAG